MLDAFLTKLFGIGHEALAARIELATKLLISFGAGCYCVGLIIVNGYLLAYGVHSLSLLRGEYVTAGLLWAFLSGAGVLSILDLVSSIAQLRQRWTTGRRFFSAFRVIVSIAILPFMFLSPIGLLTGRMADVSDPTFWKLGGIVLLTSAMLVSAGYFVSGDLRRWSVAGGEIARFPTYQAVIQCFIVLASISLYSRVAYPAFLPMWGGGHPTEVQLVLSDAAAADEFKRLAGQTESEKELTFNLIAETEDWLILARPAETARGMVLKGSFRLRRETVSLIQVKPKPYER